MTTFAYRDGVLAIDRLVTQNHCRAGSATKYAIIEGVGVLAVVGKLGAVHVYADWLRNWPDVRVLDRPSMCDESDGLLILKTGQVIAVGDCAPCELYAPFHAEGSGAQYALGAMAMGASAEQAVRAAARFDTHTSDEIDVLKLALLDEDDTTSRTSSSEYRQFTGAPINLALTDEEENAACRTSSSGYRKWIGAPPPATSHSGPVGAVRSLSEMGMQARMDPPTSENSGGNSATPLKF